jgi:aminoglycoside phosphotransferase family enzyme
MKRLPDEGMMKKLLKDERIIEKHIDLIVEVLVPFYKSAKTGEEVNKYGSIETIFYNTNENFEQTKDFIGVALTEEKYNYIVKYNNEFIKQNKALFEKRIKEGFIRDGHGGLYF